MFYYEIALLKVSAPRLIYCSNSEIDLGSVVSISLKGSVKEGVVTTQVEQPSFSTVEILSVREFIYTQEQLDIAKFMAHYYFSSFGEAISLFAPYPKTPQLFDAINLRITPPHLTPQQQKAYEEISQKNLTLLFGVTGSGKTEIFISLVAKILEKGKSAIFLMPEISLTPQMEKRLSVYFGESVAIWHSKLTKKKKEQILEDIGSGKVRLIAGARSALFVPLHNIGLIIVDEEHDDSYKSMTRPRYNARDIALLMGKKIDAKVVLASATPSASSYHKYPVVKLSKPYIQTHKNYHFVQGTTITSEILQAIASNYQSGGQGLVFVPTRGNFKYLYCEQCGKTHLCPFCSVGMALHRYRKHIRCHYCGYSEAIIEQCSYCGHAPLQSERMGTVEVIEHVKQHIPSLTIEQFDKDSITSSKKLKEALERFESQESRVIVGTQMLSKGHDYANITLSVIMGLDYILGLADYRAKEKAMSLLVQIAGRSGRAKEANILIQSNYKEVFEPYLLDYEAFLKDELHFLEGYYPPFVWLARIMISNKNALKAEALTEQIAKSLSNFQEVEIIGSGKAPIEKIAGKFRFHILVRSQKRTLLLKALHAVNQKEIEIDMDPVDFA